MLLPHGQTPGPRCRPPGMQHLRPEAGQPYLDVASVQTLEYLTVDACHCYTAEHLDSSADSTRAISKSECSIYTRA